MLLEGGGWMEARQRCRMVGKSRIDSLPLWRQIDCRSPEGGSPQHQVHSMPERKISTHFRRIQSTTYSLTLKKSDCCKATIHSYKKKKKSTYFSFFPPGLFFFFNLFLKKMSVMAENRIFNPRKGLKKNQIKPRRAAAPFLGTLILYALT